MFWQLARQVGVTSSFLSKSAMESTSWVTRFIFALGDFLPPRHRILQQTLSLTGIQTSRGAQGHFEVAERPVARQELLAVAGVDEGAQHASGEEGEPSPPAGGRRSLATSFRPLPCRPRTIPAAPSRAMRAASARLEVEDDLPQPSRWQDGPTSCFSLRKIIRWKANRTLEPHLSAAIRNEMDFGIKINR